MTPLRHQARPRWLVPTPLPRPPPTATTPTQKASLNWNPPPRRAGSPPAHPLLGTCRPLHQRGPKATSSLRGGPPPGLPPWLSARTTPRVQPRPQRHLRNTKQQAPPRRAPPARAGPSAPAAGRAAGPLPAPPVPAEHPAPPNRRDEPSRPPTRPPRAPHQVPERPPAQPPRTLATSPPTRSPPGPGRSRAQGTAMATRLRPPEVSRRLARPHASVRLASSSSHLEPRTWLPPSHSSARFTTFSALRRGPLP